MAATQQPPNPPVQAGGGACANCGAPMAADQRYCLNCGARTGEPRVPAEAPVAEPASAPAAPRPADVSPLAAVIGIALLGGMLLIGVLIGREAGGDDTTPAPVVQVGQSTAGEATTPAAPPASTPSETTETPPPDGEVTVPSEWPEGTDGWTIQLSSVPKADATPESVESSKQGAVDQGATDAAVLDSDLYPTLTPGLYIVYSGVYTDRKSAEVGLKALGKNFANATVVEVSGGGGSSADDTESGAAPAPGAGGEDELSPEVGEAK